MFDNMQASRTETLYEYMMGLIQKENGLKLLEKHQILETAFLPTEIVASFDLLLDRGASLDEAKWVSNKLFNVLHQHLVAYEAPPTPKNSAIDFLIKDNALGFKQLTRLRPEIKAINQEQTKETKLSLLAKLASFEPFIQHYVVMQNLLFPIMEAKWAQHQCVKMLWSFQDDVKRCLAQLAALLEQQEMELPVFNNLCGQLFFTVSTLIFREERIIYPLLLEGLEKSDLDQVSLEMKDLGLPFVALEALQAKPKRDKASFIGDEYIHLPTGSLTAEQFNLIFSHLPVDITYVDENDRVCFFSDPPHRIFTRTPAVIGRKVQMCHPHESVHIVEKIVEAFRNGSKNEATFWAHIKDKYVLIQYFAVRDKEGNYRGTLEVSQEISEIQKISGNRRLLDWE